MQDALWHRYDDAMGNRAILALVFAGICLQAGCGKSNSMCGTDLSARVVSPDGSRSAVLYGFDCGAFSEFTSQVSILKAAEELPNERGNVLAAEGRGLPLNEHHVMAIQLKWIADDELEIHHPAAAQIGFKRDSVDGIRIRFIPDSP